MRASAQTDRAIELGNQVLSTSLSARGPVHRSVILARFALALALTDAGRDVEADEQMVLDIEALRQLEDMRSELPNHLAWRGEILIRQQDFALAVEVLEEAEAIRDREFPDEPRRYRVAAQQRLVQAHAAQGECKAAQNYLAPIAADIADGNADQALATDFYLLNCLQESGDAQHAYRELIQSVAQRAEISASLRAAMNWAHQAGSFSG